MTDIIIQMHASITSEAMDNLGEYEENATEKQKDIDIQDRTQAPYWCFLQQQDIGWSRSRVPVLRWCCEL
jgi:hypothetical protein